MSSLSHIHIQGDTGVAALAEEILKRTGVLFLKVIDLYENSISDAGARALAKSIKHGSHLRELYLWGNSIGNDGATSLANAIAENNELESLVLWNNRIGDSGAESLLAALDVNKRLKKLYLTGNRVSPDTMARVKARLSFDEVEKRRNAAEERGLDCVVSDW